MEVHVWGMTGGPRHKEGARRMNMDKMDKGETRQTSDYLSRGQIKMYARELQSHFQRERNLRQELEQRHRELSALNRMFQEHLRQRFAGVGACSDCVNSLRRISLKTADVTERAERELLPGEKRGQIYPPLST